MRRLLRNKCVMQNQSTRYYHYDTQGKSPMGSPHEQPVPPAYQLGNIYDAFPEIYQGFKHHPQDPYVQQAVNLYDNWEYTENGEWWNMGSLVCNIIWASFPVLLYLLTKAQHENSLARKSCGYIKYSDRAGYTPYSLYYHDIENLND